MEVKLRTQNKLCLGIWIGHPVAHGRSLRHSPSRSSILLNGVSMTLELLRSNCLALYVALQVATKTSSSATIAQIRPASFTVDITLVSLPPVQWMVPVMIVELTPTERVICEHIAY